MNALATVVCTNSSCIEANSPIEECECACGGEGHGPVRARLQKLAAEALQARSDYKGGFTSVMLAEIDDEKW